MLYRVLKFFFVKYIAICQNSRRTGEPHSNVRETIFEPRRTGEPDFGVFYVQLAVCILV